MKVGARIAGGIMIALGTFVAFAVDMFPGFLLIFGGILIAVFT